MLCNAVCADALLLVVPTSVCATKDATGNLAGCGVLVCNVPPI